MLHFKITDRYQSPSFGIDQMEEIFQKARGNFYFEEKPFLKMTIMVRQNNMMYRIAMGKKLIDIKPSRNNEGTSYKKSRSLFLVKEPKHHQDNITGITVCLKCKQCTNC